MRRTPLQFESFDELERFLRDWQQWDWLEGDTLDDYDFAGMIILFNACLDNLRTNAHQAELEDIGGYLRDEQRAFLKKLAELVD